MNKIIQIIFSICIASSAHAQSILSPNQSLTSFSLDNVKIYVDDADYAVVKKSAALLQLDIEMVTGKKPDLVNSNRLAGTNPVIIIGSTDRSAWLKTLIKNRKVSTNHITNKWEAWQIQTITDRPGGDTKMIVITGSDRRGVAFGVFEFSKQIGVSPWYWWADVPVKKKDNIFIKANILHTDAPKVKYRGIFINDEAPALSNWSKEKFGGFNHKFYEKVFELLLRLKANYIWPAMWGNAFYDDDALNIKAAEDYAIVIGTSHHEPLMRAHDEWRRYGKKQKWNYDSTEMGLKEFWRGGMQRATNEKIVSVGMRGDGDEPMSRETATTLLERIVADQRKIIEEVTGKHASETPQLWALYKEVQDYYDKGMRVPDDVTLLLCDDNWGNIRKLPKLDEKPRNGGYGIYYHFDYVGGPRNYKWINTNHIPRVWEQMHIAYQYGVKNIWIVNVGDIKPMEFPISFFLDYAWNPEKIGADDLQKYTEQWSAAQFGEKHAKEIAEVISKYSKYNARRKPELLDASTYQLHEWISVTNEYHGLLKKSKIIEQQLPKVYKNAYFQLVHHPVKAMANLCAMYYNVALNRKAVQNKYLIASEYAQNVKKLFDNDSLISLEYHKLNNGKWNHMMSQTHIGYTYWQQPPVQKMPDVRSAPSDSNWLSFVDYDSLGNGLDYRESEVLKGSPVYHWQGKFYSIEANHFSKAVNTNNITWKVLPDHGRTGSAVTPFPVNSSAQNPGTDGPHLVYEIKTHFEIGDTLKLLAYFSPTLNFHSTSEGLQYAVSIDDEQPQIVSLNKEDKTTGSGIWNKWVAENIIIKTTVHKISKADKHILKYWMVSPGVVLQKIVIDFGGLKPSYLGPPETITK